MITGPLWPTPVWYCRIRAKHRGMGEKAKGLGSSLFSLFLDEQSQSLYPEAENYRLMNKNE